MKIRQLTQQDWQAFKNLRLEALTQHPEAFGSSFEEESTLTDVELQQRFSSCDLFGAFVHDELIGCAGFFVYSSEKMSHRGCLFSMYTKKAHRNSGVADALIKIIIAHAKTSVMQLHITVVTTNHIAIRLYQNNGFHIYGTEPRSLKIGEHFYDEHLMVLVFSSNQSILQTNIETPDEQDINYLTHRLNEETPYRDGPKPFAFFIRDNANTIIAGCSGEIMFGSIYTGSLWVHPAYRKQGLARQLMEKVHHHGYAMGCHIASVLTMSFQSARGFYEKLGYECDLERHGYIGNSSCLFLKKQL